MLHRKSLCTILVLILVGCTNNSVNFNSKLQSIPLCCSDISAINYMPVQYDKAVTSMLGGRKSLARQFPEGKSFFIALQLPPFTHPYELQIDSLSYGDALFPPKVQLLDENFQLRKAINPEQFQYSNGRLSSNTFVNQDQGYRYLLIYTDPGKLGGKKSMRLASSSTTSIASGGYLMHFRSGNDESSEVVVSAGGQVSVLVKKYAPRKLQ